MIMDRLNQDKQNSPAYLSEVVSPKTIARLIGKQLTAYVVIALVILTCYRLTHASHHATPATEHSPAPCETSLPTETCTPHEQSIPDARSDESSKTDYPKLRSE